MRPSLRRGRCVLVVAAAFVAALVVAASAGAARHAAIPTLHWADCGDGFQCATAEVPRNYKKPKAAKLELAVVRLPATDTSHRIGSLFINFGGPGGDAVATIKAIGRDLFGSLNDRFDIVGFDPRGVGESNPAIDCKIDQEKLGLYAQPFTTPDNLDVGDLVARSVRYGRRCVNLNPGILPWVATANVARDMNLLRAAVGDSKLNYLGFSYGTYLGATYARLFPHRFRALVLDGPLDAEQYANQPTDNLRAQTAGFERALGRFFQACAAHQSFCGFGGDDPWAAFDELLEQADVTPLPATNSTDPRPVDGDDIRAGAVLTMYAKQFWPLLAIALQDAAAGDGSLFRDLADSFYGRNPDGTFDPASDRYFTIEGVDQRFRSDVGFYLQSGLLSWSMFDHAWWNTGYSELPWGLYPVEPRGAYFGPFGVPSSSPKSLVVATTYDPATPYRGAKQLVTEMGNARLLTMRGDGHTAYGGNSPCIDAAVDAYLETKALPPAGTVCQQEVPFEPVQARQARPKLAPAAKRVIDSFAPHVKPILAAHLR